MKLSDKTLTILKNFSSINESLLFRKGNSIRTISVMKNILAEAIVEENFPKDFAIYDLNQFLNNISLLKNPELNFDNEKYVVIREGKSKSKYFFAPPNTIVTPPDKYKFPSEDISFDLSTRDLDKLMKASSVNHLPDLSVVGEHGVIKLLVRDKKDDTSNEFSVVVGESNEEFEFNFKVENIRILPGNYNVVISKPLFSKFVNKNSDLTYIIALEP